MLHSSGFSLGSLLIHRGEALVQSSQMALCARVIAVERESTLRPFFFFFQGGGTSSIKSSHCFHSEKFGPRCVADPRSAGCCPPPAGPKLFGTNGPAARAAALQNDSTVEGEKKDNKHLDKSNFQRERIGRLAGD